MLKMITFKINGMKISNRYFLKSFNFHDNPCTKSSRYFVTTIL
jgi:hypothetical protein